jgi:hypothetical protein
MIEIIIVSIVVSIAAIYILIKYKRKIVAIFRNDKDGVCKSCPYIGECSKVDETSDDTPHDCNL